MSNPNPNGWDSGPPESKSESWNYERRNELLNVSSAILQAQVAAAMRITEDWDNARSPLDAIDPQRTVQLAQQLIEEADRIRPKR